jgi:hypothetical protein
MDPSNYKVMDNYELEIIKAILKVLIIRISLSLRLIHLKPEPLQ